MHLATPLSGSYSGGSKSDGSRQRLALPAIHPLLQRAQLAEHHHLLFAWELVLQQPFVPSQHQATQHLRRCATRDESRATSYVDRPGGK